MYHTIDRYAEPDWAGERLSATREGMRMEYRGFHYQVVRKISPNGWRWSVQLDNGERSGTDLDRAVAIRRAQTFIDKQIKKRERPAK